MPFDRPFNFNPFNLYQLPLEQYRIFSTARYEVNDDIEVFGEGLFVQSTTATTIAPSGTFRNVLTTPLSNPFLNAGIRNQVCGFDTQADDPTMPATIGVQRRFTQAECDAAATATDPDDPNYRTVDLDYGRRFVEFGTRDNEYETQLFQAKVGARGDFVGLDGFFWELFGAYGESENDSRQSGNGTFTRLQQSVLATNPTTCLDPSNGCVPINLFGPLGSLTPDVQAFLDVGNGGSTSTTLGQFQAFVGGDLFTLFADTPVAALAGFEYRDYTASTVSDVLTQTPGEVLGNGAATPDTFGRYDVVEAFGELNIPVLEDVSFAQELSLNLVGRLSNYSTIGQEFMWSAGGTWTPVIGFQIRGSYSNVTRAPNIGELFEPPVTGLDNFDSDPCSDGAPIGNAALTATCLAQGASLTNVNAIQVDPAGQVNVTSGGNPNLAGENAYTWTIGTVIQPDFLPGFSATVDYYNIIVRDAITEPTIGDVFDACFTQNGGAGSATDPACTSIRRNPATGNLFGNVGTTQGLPLVLTNQGRIQTDGIDVIINYTRDFSDNLGVALSFAGNWTNTHEFQANQDDPNGLNRDCLGFNSINCSFTGSIIPEFSFNTRATFMFDPFDISLAARFVDEVQIEPLANQGVAIPPSGNCPPSNPNRYDGRCRPFLEDFTQIPSEVYLDIALRTQVLDYVTVVMAVNNVLDNDPKIVGSNIGATAFNSGNIYPSTYDPLGRRYSISATLTF